MKATHLYLIIAAVVLVSCDKSKKITEAADTGEKVDTVYVLNNNIDSLSYAVGMNIAQNFAQQGITLNGEAMARGIQDYTDTTFTWDPQMASIYIQTEIQKMEEAKAEELSAEGKKFLEENAKKPNVKTTPSGLQYIILEEGTGEYPKPADKVTVHYTGTLIDGTKFDSSLDRGTPATFGLNQVIKGWTEGLQLVKEGGKIRLFIPQELGYGARAAGSIPPYSTLIFDVELLDIVDE